MPQDAVFIARSKAECKRKRNSSTEWCVDIAGGVLVGGYENLVALTVAIAIMRDEADKNGC